METPLVAAFLPDRAAKQAVRAAGCQLLAMPSRARLLRTELPQPPRLFLLQASSEELAATQGALEELERNWPLTDVLVWMPQGGGAAVRSLFHAGAKDVVVGRSPAQLADSIQAILGGQQILPRLNALSRRQNRGGRFESMLSRSPAMWDLFDLCTRVAPADVTVLIVGETGTGKELLARALHRCSGRRGRFVVANCASIPSELLQSELFGYEKGAFTGADRSKKGLVMHAHQGTLFLDEIGDMPLEAQQSLLRLLQEKHIRAVGSQFETKVDVRIVAATNVLLDQAVREARFREDLFYRLDVIRFNVPGLRQRPEDILFLFGHFTKRLAKYYGLEPPTFSESFFDALLEYPWPGNVRQLENFSERLVLARPQRALQARDFESLLSTSPLDPAAVDPRDLRRTPERLVDSAKSLEDNLAPLLEQREHAYLQAVLCQHHGRIAETARQAGISRRTLLRKMKRHGLDKQDYKTTANQDSTH